LANPDHPPVVIVGAGLAGLGCAVRLHREGIPVVLLEAADRVGGRVATDVVEGFRLDVGFQVLLTSYPEARAQLDLDALELRSFRPGSLVREHDRTTRVADPWREPLLAIRSLASPLVRLADGWRAARLRRRLTRADSALGATAAEILVASGISPRLRHAFFEPFFTGVTLDDSLSIPGDYFAFLFRMFAQGHAALPKNGMGAIPEQLASHLPRDAVRTGCPVRSIDDRHVTLDDGSRIAASAVVVATDGRHAAQLCDLPAPSGHRATTTHYFAASEPPFEDPVLMLNGTGQGSIVHLSVPSQVQHSYAPDGQHLVAVSVLGADAGDAAASQHPIRKELTSWFPDADRWRHLRSYRIPCAQPTIRASGAAAMAKPGFVRQSARRFVCGDHLATPSIQGALLGGRNAAEALIEARNESPS